MTKCQSTINMVTKDGGSKLKFFLKNSTLFFLMLIYSNFSIAQDNIWIVSETTCKSGASVNSTNTLSVGESVQITEKDYDKFICSLDGNRLTLVVDIEYEGSTRQSGKSPCPKGDKLIIEFVKE